MPNPFRQFISPQVRRHLIIDQGEFIVEEVTKHWVTLVKPIAMMLLCIPIFLSIPAFHQAWELPVLGGLALLCWSLFLIHREHMDRFVITNMRVFRVNGVFNQKLATMPIAKILDISLQRPFLGTLFNYGHFVLENAAQDQGLREIKYVGNPDAHDLTIQSLIELSGLRKSVDRKEFEELSRNAADQVARPPRHRGQPQR